MPDVTISKLLIAQREQNISQINFPSGKAYSWIIEYKREFGEQKLFALKR